jgi:hypothetical protein
MCILTHYLLLSLSTQPFVTTVIDASTITIPNTTGFNEPLGLFDIMITRMYGVYEITV